jgi:membrane protein YdbS with pleckstrin-like domain
MRVVGLLVLVWLIVGAIAAGQRGYFTHASQNCSNAGTIAVTVLAGPLNYAGVNPKVASCNVPQPSP